MNRKINKKGFTLTEILAVIAILGVILAIAVPSYNSLSKKFEKAYYEKLEGSVLAAAKSYYKENAESRPAELLYSNVVTFSDLIKNKNIDDIKGYKSNSNLKGRVIIVKKEKDYDYKMCYLNSNNNEEDEKKGGTPVADEDLLEKLGIESNINANNCDTNWLSNKASTFKAEYGNTDEIYLYYSETNNPETIKRGLGVTKTLTKISPSGAELETVKLENTKYYPENITAIDLRAAKERDKEYKLIYRIKTEADEKGKDLVVEKKLHVVRYDAPDVKQSNGMVELNWNTNGNEIRTEKLGTRFSEYQYREKKCDGKWNNWVDIIKGTHTHSFNNSSNICDGIVTAQFRWNDDTKPKPNTSKISAETEIIITPKLDPSLNIKSFIDNDPNKLYDYNWTNKDVTIRLTAKGITTDNSIVNASKNNELIDITIDDNQAVKDVVASENTKVSEKSTGTEYDFRLRDKDGNNLGLSDIQYIKIDKTKPLVDIKVTTTSYKELYSYTSSTGTKKPSGGMEWTNSAPRIYYNVFVKDELSGIDEVKITKKIGTISYNAYGVQEQEPDEYSSVSAYKTYSENGYKRYFIPIETDMYNETITVTVTDKAGNSVSEETKIKYDKTPPSVVIEYTSTNVLPMCFDTIGGSGRDNIYYKTSANASWSRFYIILARDKDVQRYYAKCTDKAGNSSETSEPNNSTTSATYSITFNSNGGTGSMSPITNIKSGETKTLTKNTFTREGYTFAGWSTSSGSSTVKYADGAQVKVTASIQLYAVWNQKSVKTFTVTFNHLKAVWMSQTNTTKSCQTTGNSCQIKLENLTAPSGGNQRSQSTNPTVKSKGNNPYSNLVTVSGWYTNSNGTGTKYSPNATITVSSNMTLYAIVKTKKTRFYAFPNEEYGLYCRKAAGQAYAKQNFKGMILTNSGTRADYESTDWKYTGGKMWFVGYVDPSNLCGGGSLGVGKVCTNCWVPGDWVDW